MTEFSSNLNKKQFDYPEQDPDYEGEPLHEGLKNGPLEDRQCRDVFWCLLFIGMISGFVFTSIYVFKNGDAMKILSPWDSNGQQCGFGAASEYTYIFFNQASAANSLVDFFCVHSCPTNAFDLVNCYTGNNTVCPTGYPTYKLLTVCFPDNDDESAVNSTTVTNLLTIDGGYEALNDVLNSWPMQVANLLVAFILAMILTVLIKYFAACLVWVSIFLYFCVLVTLGTLAYENATNPQWQSAYVSSNNTSNFLEGVAYTCWAIAGISFLILLCMLKKVQLAVAIMKAAADFTREVWEAAFVPLSVYAFMGAFFTWWFFTTIYLLSLGTVTASAPIQMTVAGSNYAQPLPIGTVQYVDGEGWLLFYDVFCLYWVCNFIMAFAQFVIASAVSMWYFSHLGADLSFPISKSVIRGLWHHAGSMALGSLILAFIGLIRLLMDQVHKALKTSVMNKHGSVVEGIEKCWFCYCDYCLKCFEKFVRFINQNAYIIIGLNGKSFCSAAHEAFYLISRNASKVAVTHGLGEVFCLLGNVFIGFSSALVGYICLTQMEYFQNLVVSPILPTFIILIVALVIGSLFMNVYGMAVDTILICYIVDYELFKHEGGAKSIPPSLKEFLSEYK